MGDYVNIVTPEGVRASVPREDLERYSPEAVREESFAETAGHVRRGALKRQATTPGQTAQAVAEAVGRGVTGGLSDYLLTELGAAGGDIGARQEGLGGLGTAIEMSSLIGSSLLSGGSSLAAKIAGKTPVGMLTRSTRALGEAATKRLGGGTLAAMAGYGLEGFVDGGVFNSAQAISEAAITNKKITGEDVAGAFVSGGLTGLVPGTIAGVGFGIGARQARKLRGLIDEGSEAGAAVAQASDNVFGMARRLDDEALAGLNVPSGRVIGTKAPKTTTVMDIEEVPAGREFFGTKAPGVDPRQAQLDSLKAKYQTMSDPIPDMSPGVFKRIKAEKDEVLRKIEALEGDMAKVSAVDPVGLSHARGYKMARALEHEELAGATRAVEEAKNIRYATARTIEHGPYKEVGALDDATGLGAALGQDAAAYTQAGIAKRKFLDALGSDEISGRAFSKALSTTDIDKARKVVVAYNDYIAETRKLYKKGLELRPGHVAKKGEKTALEMLDQLDVGLREAVDKAVAARLGTKAAKSFTSRIPELAGTLQVVESVQQEVTGIDVNPMSPGAEGLLAMLALGRFRNAARAGKKTSGLLGFIGGAAGSRMGSNVGARISGVMGAPSIVQAGARGLGSALGYAEGRALLSGTKLAGAARGVESDALLLAQRQMRAEGRIARAFTKFAEGHRVLAPVTVKATNLLKDFIAAPDVEVVKPTRGIPEATAVFLTAQRQIKAAMGNPMSTLAKIEENTAVLDLIDPEVALEARDRAYATLEFLHSKLPQNPGTQQTVFGDEWSPSLMEVNAWLRYFRAATDPASIYEDLAAGRLTSEAAETARELHPGHIGELAKWVSQNQAKVKKFKIGSKMQLGMLLGLPTHTSFNQFNGLQGHFTKMSEAAAQQAPPEPAGGGARLNESTKAQELGMR